MGFLTYLLVLAFGVIFIRTKNKRKFTSRIFGFPFYMLGFTNPVRTYATTGDTILINIVSLLGK